MSPAHFSRQFRATYGETPYGYLMTLASSGRRHCSAAATFRSPSLHGASDARRSARSAHGSPNWWARRRRPIGPTTTACSLVCRAASPRTSPVRAAHRAGSEKRRRARSVGSRSWIITLSQCFVIVTDPDPALAFYRDALGLELRNDVARGDFRWITVGAASQPGVSIVLTNYLNGSPADAEAVTSLVAKGALNGVHFHTDDLDATFAKVRDFGRRGRVRAGRPTVGREDFAVRDPSGNLVRIDQPPPPGRDATEAAEHGPERSPG